MTKIICLHPKKTETSECKKNQVLDARIRVRMQKQSLQRRRIAVKHGVVQRSRTLLSTQLWHSMTWEKLHHNADRVGTRAVFQKAIDDAFCEFRRSPSGPHYRRRVVIILLKNMKLLREETTKQLTNLQSGFAFSSNSWFKISTSFLVQSMLFLQMFQSCFSFASMLYAKMFLRSFSVPLLIKVTCAGTGFFFWSLLGDSLHSH